MAGSMCTDFFCICSRLLQPNEIREVYDLPPAGTHGMYCILEFKVGIYKAIYVGTGDIRVRLLNHFNGYDNQKIGCYLKQKVDKYNIKISWVIADKGCYTEYDVIECVATAQGEWPEFNMQKGNKS